MLFISFEFHMLNVSFCFFFLVLFSQYTNLNIFGKKFVMIHVMVLWLISIKVVVVNLHLYIFDKTFCLSSFIVTSKLTRKKQNYVLKPSKKFRLAFKYSSKFITLIHVKYVQKVYKNSINCDLCKSSNDGFINTLIRQCLMYTKPQWI